MTLILMGFFIIFFTYFYTDKQKETVKKPEQEESRARSALERNFRRPFGGSQARGRVQEIRRYPVTARRNYF